MAVERLPIPADTSRIEITKALRYKVVLKSEKIKSFPHSCPRGRGLFEGMMTYAKPNINVPASKKRTFAKISGSAERIPILVATDAEAHNEAKKIPVRMFFKLYKNE